MRGHLFNCFVSQILLSMWLWPSFRSNELQGKGLCYQDTKKGVKRVRITLFPKVTSNCIGLHFEEILQSLIVTNCTMKNLLIFGKLWEKCNTVRKMDLNVKMIRHLFSLTHVLWFSIVPSIDLYHLLLVAVGLKGFSVNRLVHLSIRPSVRVVKEQDCHERHTISNSQKTDSQWFWWPLDLSSVLINTSVSANANGPIITRFISRLSWILDSDWSIWTFQRSAILARRLCAVILIHRKKSGQFNMSCEYFMNIIFVFVESTKRWIHDG